MSTTISEDFDRLDDIVRGEAMTDQPVSDPVKVLAEAKNAHDHNAYCTDGCHAFVSKFIRLSTYYTIVRRADLEALKEAANEVTHRGEPCSSTACHNARNALALFNPEPEK